MRFTQEGGYLHQRTFNCCALKYMYSLQLIHCPNGVLLVVTFEVSLTSHQNWPSSEIPLGEALPSYVKLNYSTSCRQTPYININ